MDKITVIKSVSPSKVCKTYTEIDGKLEKNVIANINEGTAVTLDVPDAKAMARVLNNVTNRQDLVICAGVWHHANVGETFKVMSEPALAKLLNGQIGSVPGGVINYKGELVSARLKRGIDYSSWMLLDADNPPGMPDEWAEMSIGERLKLWDAFVPGISACERIELCGSSARVQNFIEDDGNDGKATHAWIKVSHPDKIAILKAHIRVEMVRHNVSFTYNRKAKDGGEIIGREDRSVFDLAVLDTGRLVFCAQPEVRSPMHTVEDANVTIVNEGGGPLDISWVELPKQRALEDLRQKTGLSMRLSLDNGNVSTIVSGELSLDTPIEVKGITRSLRDWADNMSVDEKLRCEAPFRESQSEAAFIRIGENGNPFVYDIGNGTTYKLHSEYKPDNPLDDFDIVPDAETPKAPDSKKQAEVASAVAQVEMQEPTGSFDDWVFLTRRAMFRNVFTGEECNASAFNMAYGRDVPEIEVGEKVIRPAASKYLMHFLDGRVAHDYLYVPALATGDPLFEYEGVKYVNSYMLNRVPQVDPAWQGSDAWKVCENHLKNILPNDWEQVLLWMAHNVQKPGAKVLWSPIIKGIQGDGKSTLARIMSAAMGDQNVRMIATEEMQSDFNGWAEGSCVGVLEEIRVKGHNRHDAMNKLKPLVTNEKIAVVRKGQDGRNIINSTNYMALTNHEDALVLDADDRRWGVFFTRFSTRDEMVAATGAEYWRRLNDAINSSRGAIRGWLMSVDLSGFDATDAPHTTDAKRLMIQHSRSNDEVAVEEAMDIGSLGVGRDVVSTKCLSAVMKEAGVPVNTSRLSAVMEKAGMTKVDGTIKWRGSNHRVYVRDASISHDDGASKAAIRALLDATDDADEAADFDDIVTPIKGVAQSWIGAKL